MSAVKDVSLLNFRPPNYREIEKKEEASKVHSDWCIFTGKSAY